MAGQRQAILAFGPVRNSELFANHWLERRLRDEPEWEESRGDARDCLDALAQLWTEHGEIVQSGVGEAMVERTWVQPTLERMGWELFYQTHIQGRKPDYALFLDRGSFRAAVEAGKTNADFWLHPTVVADAKDWNVSLDRPAKVGGKREFPPEQVEDYLRLTLLEWGLLTNGRLWRLSPRMLRRNQPRFQTYLELDLPRLIEYWTGGGGVRPRSEAVLDEWMRWYLLATPVAFRTVEDRPTPLIDRALNGSSEYRLGVGENLREQVFRALRICIQGFFANEANGLHPERDLDECRTNAFAVLFRLLFILYAEDRGLLPYRRNSTYTNNRSLSHHHEELIPRLDAYLISDLDPASTAIWW